MTNQQNQYFAYDPLDNFRDLAEKTKVIKTDVKLNPLDFDFSITVKLDGIDDLVLAIEQDYYLERAVKSKLHYIHKDPQALSETIRLTEMYLSANSQVSAQAEQAKKYALNNLHVI